MSRLPLAISVGDPAGVGPKAVAEALRGGLDGDQVLLFGDARFLAEQLDAVGQREHQIIEQGQDLEKEVGIVHVVDWSVGVINNRRPNAEGGKLQFQGLEAAIDAVQAQRARALVTGPLSKQAICSAGMEFSGHTEHLARRAGLDPDEVTMMFLGATLRVALVTTHLSISEVPRAVTKQRIVRSIRHLCEALKSLPELRGREPRIVVTGLNPHAGEGGRFGSEEEEQIVPALAEARAEFSEQLGVEIDGPIGAETAFRWAARGNVDGVVAMYHDQATIASKLVDWGSTVNTTWGLPYLRTSVDHGVGYDAAAAGAVDASGMRAAIRMAQVLTLEPMPST